MPVQWQRVLRGVSSAADTWVSRRLDRPPRSLLVLHLMVTDKCNLRCPMCGACNYEPGDHNMLATEEWKEVIRSAANLRTAIISITGGEVLLREDVFELVGCARNHGIAVHLNTNGTLLNEENVDKLRGNPPDTLSVSLEGVDPSVHDRIRGSGTFERTVTGIRRVRERAPTVSVSVNFLITRTNFRSMADMVPFAEDLGVQQIKFMPIHSNLLHRDKPLEEYWEFVFRREDLDELAAEVDRLQAALSASGLQTSSKYFFRGIRRLYEEPPGRFYCYAGYATCTVDPRGFVAPCFDKQGTLSVRERPLEAIWRSPEFQKLRHQVRTCREACWDTTNTEISLRFDLRTMIGDIRQIIRDVRFYLGDARQ